MSQLQALIALMTAVVGLGSSYVSWRTLTTPASKATLEALTNESSALLAMDELRKRRIESLEAEVRAASALAEARWQALEALRKHTEGNPL